MVKTGDWHNKDLAEHINSREVGRDLYYLYTIYASSKSLMRQSDGGDFCPNWQMRDDYEEEEILRRIVSIAIHVRIIHERHVEHYVGKKLKPSDPSVETLIPNLKQKSTAELSLRQACSKIVHAKLFSLEKIKKNRPDQSYLKPIITLHSSSTKSEGWKASVRVNDFIFAAYDFCR